MRPLNLLLPLTILSLLAGCEQNSTPAEGAKPAGDAVTGAVGGAIDAAKDAVANFGFPEGAVTFATGSFTGQNDHTVSGHIALARAGDKVYLAFAPDFSHDEAPDPKIGFGKGGSYDKATTFHELKSRSGAQLYEVPSTIDVSSFDEVYVWCEEFSVALAKAPLSK